MNIGCYTPENWRFYHIGKILCGTWFVYNFKIYFKGHLGGSVSWASDSWFWLRSWSQYCGMESCVRLCSEQGACLGFPLSAPPPNLALMLSQIKRERERVRHLTDWATQAPQGCSFKRTWAIYEDLLTNFRAGDGRMESIGTFSRNGNAGKCHYSCPPSI